MVFCMGESDSVKAVAKERVANLNNGSEKMAQASRDVSMAPVFQMVYGSQGR